MDIANSNISFIIPAFNCASTLAESVESITEGNLTSGDEIIIVNDASTDDTLKVSLELQKKYAGVIKIISHRINKGSAAAARNTAIDASNKELLFCLDADNLLSPGSVLPLKNYLIQTQSDCAAFGEIRFFVDSITNCSQTWVMNAVCTFIDNINCNKETPCSSGNYLFTKSSWRKAGRYSEDVGGAFDSWAFGCKQLATGSKMVTLKDTFYYHRVSPDSTFLREVTKHNVSLLITRILIPYFEQLRGEDINYILSPENRYTWFDNIHQHPIRLANQEQRPIGARAPIAQNEPTVGEMFRFIKAKIKRRL